MYVRYHVRWLDGFRSGVGRYGEVAKINLDKLFVGRTTACRLVGSRVALVREKVKVCVCSVLSLDGRRRGRMASENVSCKLWPWITVGTFSCMVVEESCRRTCKLVPSPGSPLLSSQSRTTQ